MEASIYVGLSGQIALERRLTTIANNVANAGTAGYRSESVHFSTIMSATGPFATEPSAQAVGAYLGRVGPLSYPVALDQTGRVADGYGVQDQPWLVLVSVISVAFPGILVYVILWAIMPRAAA